MPLLEKCGVGEREERGLEGIKAVSGERERSKKGGFLPLLYFTSEIDKRGVSESLLCHEIYCIEGKRETIFFSKKKLRHSGK